MATDILEIFGTEYSGVTGIKATDDNSNTLTYIRPEGSETKTQNGTYDVTALAQLVVNVAGSGANIETGTYKPSSDTAKPTISFSNNHSELPIFAMMIDADGYTSVANSNLIWVYYNWEQLIGGGVYTASTTLRYGEVRYSYRGTNASSVSTSTGTVSNPESNTGTSNNNYPRFSVTESGMYPYTGSTSRYWKANRTYKWIAVWKPTS